MDFCQFERFYEDISGQFLGSISMVCFKLT